MCSDLASHCSFSCSIVATDILVIHTKQSSAPKVVVIPATKLDILSFLHKWCKNSTYVSILKVLISDVSYTDNLCSPHDVCAVKYDPLFWGKNFYEYYQVWKQCT